MKHMRIAVYKFTPGKTDEVIRRAREGMLPIFRQQPGFIAYQVVKTGDDSGVSISTWDSRQQADKAVSTAASWVKDNLSELVRSVENLVGEVSLDTMTEPIPTRESPQRHSYT